MNKKNKITVDICYLIWYIIISKRDNTPPTRKEVVKMLNIEEMNLRTERMARENEEDRKRVLASQNGSYANKNLRAIFVGGRYSGMNISHSELEALGNGEFTLRFSACKSHNPSLINLDLEDQPLVDGYLSPILDGGVLRYVTQEICVSMSN